MQGEPDEHRLYVGNLDNDIDEADLYNAFSDFGSIFNVDIPRRGFGFVSYFYKQEAENAIEHMNGEYLGNRQLRVEWARGWPKDSSEDEEEENETESEENEYDAVFNQTSSNNCTVYCGGLTGYITRETIELIFSPYGEIEEITYFEDRDYAFVRFSTKEAATLAICELNGFIVNGEPIRCSWAHRPNGHNEEDASSTSSESSSESSHSYAPDFETVSNQTSSDHCTVYCGGLSGYVTEELIESVFSPYGDIDQITLYTDRSDYAFIRFSTHIAATLAICAVNGTEINGETVRCNWSHRPDIHRSEVETATSSFTSAASNSLPRQPEAAASAQSASLPKDGSKEAAKAKNMDLLCKICMDEELGVVFLPCGHLTSCAKCAQKVHNCPMCRKRITGKVRTYLS